MVISRDCLIQLLHYKWDNFNEELYLQIVKARENENR